MKMLRWAADKKSYEYLTDFIRITDDTMQKSLLKKKETHNTKLSKLMNMKQNIEEAPEVKFVDNYVKNMSSEVFTEEELNTLNLGLNYVPKPSKHPITETFAELETAIQYIYPSTTKLTSEKS